MYLFINTANQNNITVILSDNNQIIDSLNIKGDIKVSENLLNLVENLLNTNKVQYEQLKGIITVSGPGPFTSLRIAVTIANTLSYTLQVPVTGVTNLDNLDNQQLINIGLKMLAKEKVGSFIKPYYDKEPNITV